MILSNKLNRITFQENNLLKVLNQLISSHLCKHILKQRTTRLQLSTRFTQLKIKSSSRQCNEIHLFSHSIPNSEFTTSKSIIDTAESLNHIYINTNLNRQIIVSTYKAFNQNSNCRVSIYLQKFWIATSKLEIKP